MNKTFKQLSLLTIVIAAIAFGIFLSSGLNIMNLSNGDPVEGSHGLFSEGDMNAVPISFSQLAKIANPTVVNITATSKGVRHPRSNNDLLDYFFRGKRQGRNEHVRGFGSGFLISKDGYILTNFHVVSNKQRKVADDIKVKLYTDHIYKAKVIGTDSLFDVALLKIDTSEELPFLKLGNSDISEVGEWVMAIGNPSLLDHTVTVGVISAKGRQLSGAIYRTFIQTDAAINLGNSGGPLINLKGEVIGVNAMIIAGTEGIGFSIPINQVKEILPQLREKGYVQRGYIGILPENISADLKKSLKLPTDKGIFVQSVTRGSAAEKAEVKDGDIVVEFNGKKINNLEDLYRVVAGTTPGKKTMMVVIRDGKKKTLYIVPEERPGEDEPKRKQNWKKNELDETLGISVSTITDRQRRYYNIPEKIGGVVVTEVSRFSPAFDAGLSENMIIRRVNRKRITSVSDFYRDIENALKGSTVIAFYVSYQTQRGEWVSRYITVRLEQ